MIFQFQIPIITVPVVWSVCSSSPNEVFQIILVVLPIPLSSLPPLPPYLSTILEFWNTHKLSKQHCERSESTNLFCIKGNYLSSVVHQPSLVPTNQAQSKYAHHITQLYYPRSFDFKMRCISAHSYTANQKSQQYC